MSLGPLGQEPAPEVTKAQGFTPAQFKFKTDTGGVATDYAQMQQLQQQGYMKCPNPKCGFMINPQTLASIKKSSGYFTCPKCRQSYDLMNELPWHGVTDGPEEFSSGGGTRIGIPMADQAQIGESLVAGLKDLPGYGPITWVHPGGSISQSPLDMATKDWGIEVKTLGYDSLHHRFIPGRVQEKEDKNNMAAEMGLKGILAILVLLDYRRDVADIYGSEMPLETGGVKTFRKHTGQKLITEVPFKNPYKDPNNPSPQGYNANDYYQTPQEYQPPSAEPEEAMPF
jgi:hypothetical protein